MADAFKNGKLFWPFFCLKKAFSDLVSAAVRGGAPIYLKQHIVHIF